MAENMRAVLDLSKPLDTGLFDQVANCAFSGQSPLGVQKQALGVLDEFRKHPDSWTVADRILKQSSLVQSKFLALQTLDDVIHTRWHVLAEEHRLGVRNFVVNFIMELSSSQEMLAANKMLVEKLNNTLVQVLKKDWPRKWPTFIQEIVQSAQASDALMQNNLSIIRQLSEEIFDFSKGKMTQNETQLRKEALNKEFSKVFEMLHYILQNKDNAVLICQALECLLACLSWIPLGYIFETSLIAILAEKFLPHAVTRNSACSCLTEIASLTFEANNPAAPQYTQQLLRLYSIFIAQLEIIIPVGAPLRHDQAILLFMQTVPTQENRDFVQRSAQFLTSFFKAHVVDIETAFFSGARELQKPLVSGHYYLLGITNWDDKEVFKACIEYWCWLAEGIHHNRQRLQFYQEVLSELRKTMIGKMARPEEVIVFEDENGEIVKQRMKDVDAIALYTSMRETLVFLTHLNSEETETIMLDSIGRIARSTPENFSAGKLAKLCWAIGSISGSMEQVSEFRFLVAVIKDLLTLCSKMEGRPRKASIASDIMYVVGLYPRFLQEHWRFLKTVILKLFEFMQETFEGVQDMAVETFLKITHSCKQMFVMTHPNEQEPFILDLLRQLPRHTQLLDKTQTHIFYEAVGLMIGAAPPEQQDQLVQMYMRAPNDKWNSVLSQAKTNPAILTDLDTMNDLAHILKTFVCGAVSVGPGFRQQLFNIFTAVMQYYQTYAQYISQEVATKGPQVTRQKHVRAMRIIKKEILRLLEGYVQKSNNDLETSLTVLPPLLETALTDYNKSVEQARDPQVLSLMTVLVKKLGHNIENHVPQMLDAVMQVTLEMVGRDPQDFPEHRTHFFQLLQALNERCFDTFLKALQLSPAIMDAIISAMKHSKREIEAIGCETLLSFLDSISKSAVAFDFYQVYFINLLHAVFNVLTDGVHKSGFKYHWRLLFHLIATSLRTAEAGRCISSNQQPDMRADQFVKQHLALQLSAFQNLNQGQIHRFVEGLYTKLQSESAFKEHIRDFLIELQEFSSSDNAELYEDPDRAAKEEAERKRQTIPGIAPQMKAAQMIQAAAEYSME